MKRLVFMGSFLLLSISTLFACPFCGCGNSNFQLGLLPSYSKGFVGLRYTYTNFNTLSKDGSEFSHDYFHSTEIWGGYKIGKFQVMAFVPYLTSHKQGDDGVVNARGLGDILVMSNYQIFSTTRVDQDNQRKNLVHSLWLGGGIKFNTGLSKVDILNPDFSVGDFSSTPGTGSTDFLINATDNFLVGNHGLVTNVAYRINTESAQQFRYGNRVYANMSYFHSWSAGSIDIRPSAGLNLVLNDVNRYQGQTVQGSNGYVLSGTAGINVQRGKIGFLVNGFLPVAQNLFDGQTQFRVRASVALTYSF